MQAILGPFHPHLENALVEEICKYKNADLLCPLLVLVPSDALRRRLKVLLTRERNLSFLNLQLLTFYQLSAKLFAEAEGLSAPILREGEFVEGEVISDVALVTETKKSPKHDQEIRCPFLGSRIEMAFAQRFRRDLGLHHSVA